MLTRSVYTNELSRASFNRFAQFITSELGIKTPDSKLTTVQGRLLRRVRELRLESLEHYVEYFFTSANAGEREHFINEITTNKTDFFREPEHFEYLTNRALPQLTGAGVGRRLLVWSCGCSSGEEPYTLAMVLSAYEQGKPGFDFAILGTDISTRVLAQAREGIYHESQIVPVPLEFRRKYLLESRVSSRQLLRVSPELRRRVSFHRLNLMDTDYGIRNNFDAIFFRNVMIYFDRPTQEAVINKMCRTLAPGGYLFVGHSESLSGLNIPVGSVHTSIFRKPGASS